MSVPAAYTGIILIWSTTPLAIQWSSDEVGFLFGIAGMVFSVTAYSASAIVVKRIAADVPQSRGISREQQKHRTAAVSSCPDNDTATGYLLCLPCNQPKHYK